MDNLPVDVLRLIGSRLLARDRIFSRSVCRNWRSAIPVVPSPVPLTKSLMSFATMTRFPLLMYYGCEGSFYSFYHPVYNTTYVSPKIANAKIRFSKDGWLLMSQGQKEIFFFNPIINKQIDLPNVLDYSYNFTTISFSSLPTSADCTVFGVRHSSSTSISFNFIRRGEDTWTECTVKSSIEFIGSLNNPVFHNGLFYYLDRKGILGTFDPTQEGGEDGWTVLEKPKQPCNSIHRNYLFECDGELISVFLGQLGKWVKIFKLDAPTMTWRKLESLGDKMLFVSRTASFSATNSEQEVMGMENKIYFPTFNGKNGVFYSLNTCKFHTLGTGYNSDDFYGTTLKLLCTWIDPSFDTFDDEEFHW
ncbi:hypothetical protein LguiB_020905 [Lonicera macranthoides]